MQHDLFDAETPRQKKVSPLTEAEQYEIIKSWENVKGKILGTPPSTDDPDSPGVHVRLTTALALSRMASIGTSYSELTRKTYNRWIIDNLLDTD